MRIKRRDQLWLTLIGILTGIVLLGGGEALDPIVRAAAVAAFAAAVALVFLRPSLDQLRERVIPSERVRGTSQAAAEASQRARARGETPVVGLDLTDIGLIASETNTDGVTFRRTREVSNEDDGVRPYIELNAGTFNAERRARVRYEMIDPTGDTAYVHEENAYLQLGKNTLHPDHHLPLAGELPPNKLGRWDLHTYVDGRLIGMLTFMVAPTDDERRARLSAQRSDDPASFEDLLRRGSQRNDQS